MRSFFLLMRVWLQLKILLFFLTHRKSFIVSSIASQASYQWEPWDETYIPLIVYNSSVCVSTNRTMSVIVHHVEFPLMYTIRKLMLYNAILLWDTYIHMTNERMVHQICGGGKAVNWLYVVIWAHQSCTSHPCLGLKSVDLSVLLNHYFNITSKH